MKPCDTINLYLFKNGLTCNPQKLIVKFSEVENCFEKVGDCFCYQGKT